jgi:hypothetical protein
MSDFDLSSVGGKRTVMGDDSESIWNFGYIPPDDRTNEENQLDIDAKSEMIEFEITGEQATNDRAFLWECAKAANGGQHFRPFYQQTGSCVGNGGGQALWYLSAVEVVRLKDREQVLMPFWLLPYGRSRYYAGSRGQGEGSFGSAFAEAMRKDGILEANRAGLPQCTDSGNGLTWGRNVELTWSDGGKIDQKWLSLSRKHLLKSTAQVKTALAVRQALLNYYPCTIASNWGGQMTPAVQGSPPVRLNKRADTWNHQMCVIGTVNHPQLGWIYYILNSWGVNAHGLPPAGGYGEPPGGFWVNEADMDYIAKQGDSFAFSQFQGFPAQKMTWEI